MRLKIWSMAIAILLAAPLALCAQPQQEQKTITGRILDADGKAVNDAVVGTFWIAGEGKMRPMDGVTSEKDGKYSLTYQSYGQAIALLAFDKEQKTGGLAFLMPKATE